MGMMGYRGLLLWCFMALPAALPARTEDAVSALSALKSPSDWLNIEPIRPVTPAIEKYRCRMALQMISGKAVFGTPDYNAALSEFYRERFSKDEPFIAVTKEGVKGSWNKGDRLSLYVSKQDREQMDRLVARTIETYPNNSKKLDYVLQLKENLENPLSEDPDLPFLVHSQRLLGKSIVNERLQLIAHTLDNDTRRWSKRDLLFMGLAITFSLSPAAQPLADAVTPVLTTAGSVAAARILANMSRLFESLKYYLRDDFVDLSKHLVSQPEDHSMKHLSWGLRLSPEEVEKHLKELMKPEDYDRFERWRDDQPAKKLALIFDYNVTRNEIGVPVILSTLRVSKTK